MTQCIKDNEEGDPNSNHDDSASYDYGSQSSTSYPQPGGYGCPGCGGGSLQLSFNVLDAEALMTSDTTTAGLVLLSTGGDSNLKKMDAEGNIEEVVTVENNVDAGSFEGGLDNLTEQVVPFQVRKAKINPNTGDLYIAMEWPVNISIDGQDVYCGFVRVKPDGTHSCVMENFRFENWGCGSHEVNVFDFDSASNVYFLGIQEDFSFNGEQRSQILYKMDQVSGEVEAITNDNQNIFSFYLGANGAVFFKGTNNSENCWEDNFLRIIKPDGGIKRVAMPSGSHIEFFAVDGYGDLVFSASTANGKNIMRKVNYDANFSIVSEVDLLGEGNFGWPERVHFDDKGRIFMIMRNWGSEAANTLYMIVVKYNPITGSFFSELTTLTDDSENIKAFGVTGDTVFYAGENASDSTPFFRKRVVGSPSAEIVVDEDLEVYDFYVDADGSLFFSALSFDSGEYFVARQGIGQESYEQTTFIGKIKDLEVVKKREVVNVDLPVATGVLPDSYLMIAEPPKTSNNWGTQYFKIKLIDLTKESDNVYTMVSGLKFEANGGQGAEKFSLVRHSDSQVFVVERNCDSSPCVDTLLLVDVISGVKYEIYEHEDTTGPLQVIGKFADGKYLIRKGDKVKVIGVTIPSVVTAASGDTVTAAAVETTDVTAMGTGYHRFFPNWWGELKTNAVIDDKMIYALQKPNDQTPSSYYGSGRVMLYNIDSDANIDVRRRYSQVMKALDTPFATTHCTSSPSRTYHIRFIDGVRDTDHLQFCTRYDAIADTCLLNNGAINDWLTWVPGSTYPSDATHPDGAFSASCDINYISSDTVETYLQGSDVHNFYPMSQAFCPESPNEMDMDWSPANSGDPTSMCHDYTIASTAVDFESFIVGLEKNDSNQVIALLTPAKINGSSINNGFLKVAIDAAKAKASTHQDAVVSGESTIACTGFDFHSIQNFKIVGNKIYIVDNDESKKSDAVSIQLFDYDGSTCVYNKTVANELLNGVLDFYAR